MEATKRTEYGTRALPFELGTPEEGTGEGNGDAVGVVSVGAAIGSSG